MQYEIHSRKKLGIGFGSILALMVVSAILISVKASEIRHLEDLIVLTRIPSIEACDETADALDYSGSKTRQAILAGTEPSRRQDSQHRFKEHGHELIRQLVT